MAIDGSIIKTGAKPNALDISLLSSGQYMLVLEEDGKNVARSSFVKK